MFGVSGGLELPGVTRGAFLIRTTCLVLAIGTGFFLTACGGGSSDSVIPGIAPPANMSVIEPVGGAPSSSMVAPGTGGVGGFPADAEYFTDGQSIHVYDPAVEPLSLVNEILCAMRNTGAHLVVNEGPYNAQISVDACDQGSDSSAGASAAGQSSGGAEEFEIWVVDSTRASKDSPHLVSVWVPEEDSLGPRTIYVDVVMTAGADDNNPFGGFSMNFAGAPDYTQINNPFFFGSLRTVTPTTYAAAFELFEEYGDFASPISGSNPVAARSAVTVEMAADKTSGIAHILVDTNYWNGSSAQQDLQEFTVAFDSTHFLRSTSGVSNPQAYSRNSFNENVWRYDLYHNTGVDTGDRVELNSGFGFSTASGAYGWAGYHGIWVPDDVTDAGDGDTVFRDSYGDESAPEEYTVSQAPGKLVRYANQQLLLTALSGETFEWWTYDDMTQQEEIFVVEYDSIGGNFQKTALIDYSTNTVTPITPVNIDTLALGQLGMWSGSLGGPVSFVHGDNAITFFERSVVEPSDDLFNTSAEIRLLGFTQCLRSGLTANDIETGDIYHPDETNLANAYEYVFRNVAGGGLDDLTLYHDIGATGTNIQPVVVAAGQAPTTGPNTWGMQSGPMVLTTGSVTSVWELWSEPVIYVWETGHNDWNHYTVLYDAEQQPVSFDRPISFNYVHATADDRNDDNTHDGRTFRLEYGGNGDLWGLPTEADDIDADGTADRWFPVVNLKDGTLCGPTGNEYVIKAREIEQTLQEDMSYAGTLDLTPAVNLTLPDGTGFSTPDIGEKPVVTDAPRVIDGEVVGSGT